MIRALLKIEANSLYKGAEVLFNRHLQIFMNGGKFKYKKLLLLPGRELN